MKKIYAVTFNKYTNCLNDVVRHNKEMRFLDVGLESFLIPEDKIAYYMEFGGGFKSMIFVGNMEE